MEYKPVGLFYEEFEVGFKWRTSARTVGEVDVASFAGLTGDYTFLHTDAESASKTVFGGRIAHGLLGLSYISGLITRLGILEGTVEAFMGVEMKFRKPIMFDDTIHAEVVVKEKRISSKGHGLVTLGVVVNNQRSEVVQDGVFALMIAKKEK